MVFNEEQKELCKSCNECGPWLKYCQAECCRKFYVSVKNIGKLNFNNTQFVSFPIKLDADLVNYYKLHNCVYERGWLKVRLEGVKVLSDDRIIVLNKCSALDKNNRCKLYGMPNRPEICNLPNPAQYKGVKGIELVDSCLYKCKVEVEDAEAIVDAEDLF